MVAEVIMSEMQNNDNDTQNDSQKHMLYKVFISTYNILLFRCHFRFFSDVFNYI